jgi:hypothetical protein
MKKKIIFYESLLVTSIASIDFPSIATVAAPIVAMSHVFVRSVPDAAYVTVYSFGPAMMTFSTVLVAFYWSGLIFYKKKSQLWNRKLFIGLLAFFLVSLCRSFNNHGVLIKFQVMLLLWILSGLFFGSATQIILVVIIVIAAVSFEVSFETISLCSHEYFRLVAYILL